MDTTGNKNFWNFKLQYEFFGFQATIQELDFKGTCIIGLEWEEAFEILKRVGQLMGDADGLIGRCDFISGLFQVC